MEEIKYYSQFGQDKFIIENVFGGIKNGYFIECGAEDGIHISNTYTLEKYFDWNGICIECNPSSFKKLSLNRKSLLYDKPITHHGEMVEFNFIEDYGYYCSLFSSIYQISDNFKEHYTKILLKSETLNTVLNKFNSPDIIDYLSLDTEGGELEILEEYFKNSKSRKIKCISIEHNFFEERRNKIKILLENNGYTNIKQIDVDDIYLLT
jgi:FkbM family methyltransferase